LFSSRWDPKSVPVETCASDWLKPELKDPGPRFISLWHASKKRGSWRANIRKRSLKDKLSRSDGIASQVKVRALRGALLTFTAVGCLLLLIFIWRGLEGITVAAATLGVLLGMLYCHWVSRALLQKLSDEKLIDDPRRTDAASFARALHLASFSDGRPSRRARPIGVTFNRIWLLGGFLFNAKTRREIYEPVIEELKEDLWTAKGKCKTEFARNWVRLCFALRTLSVILACGRVACGRSLGRFVPKLIKFWWSSLR
jgi:hypothetical protein